MISLPFEFKRSYPFKRKQVFEESETRQTDGPRPEPHPCPGLQGEAERADLSSSYSEAPDWGSGAKPSMRAPFTGFQGAASRFSHEIRQQPCFASQEAK